MSASGRINQAVASGIFVPLTMVGGGSNGTPAFRVDAAGRLALNHAAGEALTAPLAVREKAGTGAAMFGEHGNLAAVRAGTGNSGFTDLIDLFHTGTGDGVFVQMLGGLHAGGAAGLGNSGFNAQIPRYLDNTAGDGVSGTVVNNRTGQRCFIADVFTNADARSFQADHNGSKAAIYVRANNPGRGVPTGPGGVLEGEDFGTSYSILISKLARPAAGHATVELSMPVVGGGGDFAFKVADEAGTKFSVTADGQIQGQSLGLTGALTGNGYALGPYAGGTTPNALAFGSTLIYKANNTDLTMENAGTIRLPNASISRDGVFALGVYAYGNPSLVLGGVMLYKSGTGMTLDTGDFSLGAAGKGIKLTSPDGTKTKTVTIDNTGALVLL